MKYTVSIKIDKTGWYEVLATDKWDLSHDLYHNLLVLLLDGEKHGFSAVMWADGDEVIDLDEI